MAKDFFAGDDKGGETPPAEKVKIGEEEFTPEQLKEAVGAWKFKKEVEEKHNTSLDKVYPEFTKTTQRVKELEDAEEARKVRIAEKKAKQADEELSRKQKEGAQLSPAEIRKVAAEQGLITDDNLIGRVLNILEGRRIMREAYKLEKAGNPYNAEELPKFDVKDMLDWMSTTPGMGNVSPETAYKLRYEKDIDAWKSKTISEGKKKGLTTETGSKPGGKEPSPIKVTRENLTEQIRAAINREI